MYPVSDEYKSIIAGPTRTWSAEVSINNQQANDNLKSIKVVRSVAGNHGVIGNICSMSATIVFLSEAECQVGNPANIQFGLELSDGSIENIPLPPMYVDEVRTDDSGKQHVTCYDYLQKTKGSKISELGKMTYPMLLSTYIGEVASMLDLEVNQIPSDRDFSLQSQPNLSGEESCWDVLGWAAEALISNLVVDRSGKLNFIFTSPSATSVETITPDNNYFKLNVGESYGPVNTLVLGRSPQEDNVYREDETSVSQYGKTELRIDNNPFLDYGTEDTRYDLIESRFTLVNGIQYIPFYMEWVTDPALDIGDKITIQNVDQTTFTTFYLGESYTFNGAISGTSDSTALTKTQTEYGMAVTEENVQRQAYLKVNKVDAEITALVQTVTNVSDRTNAALDTAQTNSTLIQQLSDGLTVAVSTSGGNNLILGSSGRTGFDDWTLSKDGYATTNTSNETTSGGYIQVGDGSQSTSILSQTVRLVPGNTYAYCFKYRVNATSESEFEIDIGEVQITPGSQSNWTEVKGSFRAQSSSGDVIITATNCELFVADMILIEGNGVSVWQQAPNEVITASTVIDARGITLTKEGEAYKAHLDNTQWEILNQDLGKRIVYADKDSSQLANTTIVDQLSVQRSEDVSHALRIIPVSNGAMFVIND